MSNTSALKWWLLIIFACADLGSVSDEKRKKIFPRFSEKIAVILVLFQIFPWFAKLQLPPLATFLDAGNLRVGFSKSLQLYLVLHLVFVQLPRCQPIENVFKSN